MRSPGSLRRAMTGSSAGRSTERGPSARRSCPSARLRTGGDTEVRSRTPAMRKEFDSPIRRPSEELSFGSLGWRRTSARPQARMWRSMWTGAVEPAGSSRQGAPSVQPGFASCAAERPFLRRRSPGSGRRRSPVSASLIIRSGIGRARIAVHMICRTCATWNREDARFCKACGRTLDDVPVAGSPRSMPGPHIPPPPAWRPRAWWHGIGVFAILAAFLVFVDASMDATVTWSYVAMLGLAFLTGGILILQFLASVEKRDRRALFAGGALLAASVVLLPVAVALQSSATITETFVVPYDPAIRNVTLNVAIEAGQIAVGFEASTEVLVRADGVHVGGLVFSPPGGDAR